MKISLIPLLLLLGCSPATKEATPPEPTPESPPWFHGVSRMWLQDESGQVYALQKLRSNDNVFEVFSMVDETNGITNMYGYDRRQWRTNANWVIHDGRVSAVFHFDNESNFVGAKIINTRTRANQNITVNGNNNVISGGDIISR